MLHLAPLTTNAVDRPQLHCSMNTSIFTMWNYPSASPFTYSYFTSMVYIGPVKLTCLIILQWFIMFCSTSASTAYQSISPQYLLRVSVVQCLSCFRTSVHLSPSSIGARDPPYACRGENVTFICQVINGVTLQWASDPEIPCDNPMSYTTAYTSSSILKLQLRPYSHSTSICKQCNSSMWWPTVSVHDTVKKN